MKSPLEGRPGLRSDNFMRGELGALAKRNGLLGCVLISFKGERVGVNCSAITDSFLADMQLLGDRILAAIDDGMFDPPDDGED